MLKKLFTKSALPILLTISAFNAHSNDLRPEIIFPDPYNGALLYGLSDNGDWGICSVPPGSDGFSDFAGAILYDLRSNPCQSVDLSQGETFVSGFDVTDDGKTVVGSFRQQPAVCRYEGGEWKWHYLPVPDRSFEVTNVFTDEKMTYRLNGGEVTNITPDGRYAVGYAECTEYIQIEVACMWDLKTMQLVDLPGLGIETSTFSRATQISADGRYVLVRRGGYQLYDRETRTTRRARVGLDIYAQGMSTDARFISGVSYDSNEIPYASFWNLATDEVTVLDDPLYSDAVAWTITNEGVPLIARPYLTPYADAYVYHDGFLFSFEDLLTQAYGMNLDGLGIDNTGKPFKVSADGRTIVLITEINNCYVIRLKENITDALDRIDLFKTRSASPASGTSMTALGDISVSFAYPLSLISDSGDIKAELLDAEESVMAYGSISVAGSTVNLRFEPIILQEGASYKVRIPEGVFGITGRSNGSNPQIEILYTGRADVAVSPVAVSPEEGTALPTFALNENPVSVTFDANIKVNVPENGSRPVARVYIDGEDELYAVMEMDVDLNSGNRLVLFPANTVPLYRGSDYRIDVPAGAVTDLSGHGASEAFSITYEGSYVPQLGDERFIFNSTCDDYSNFLFYDGDKGVPVAEYADMGFTSDTTPWVVVREDNYSTDMAFGSHSQYLDGRGSDDWVVTRQILIPDDCDAYLSFDSQSYRKNKQDYLKVYVYEYSGILNSLNELVVNGIRRNGDLVYHELQSPGANEELLAGEWTHNTVDLSKYAGKNIYIAFHNDNRGQSMVLIDNIRVVRDVKAFITLRNKTNVVNQRETPIYGILAVSGERSSFSTLSMTLKDAEGKVVSTLNLTGLNLKDGDYFNFEFPEPLPLKVGRENAFTIEYSLDDEHLSYEGLVRDLTFEPVKRVVLEEFTGRDCQFCPGGILTMEHLESLYGDRIIPVALHCYNGSDPKGAYVMGYWQFTEMGAAPQARINRGPVAAPLYQTSSGFVNSTAGLPDVDEKLWKDYVIDELAEPAFVEVQISESEPTPYNLNYTARVRSAISMDNQNIRVFGVLLEDGLIDYQINGYYAIKDPVLGEWGEGGFYGLNRVYYTFDNVARSTWGVSYNGSAGLIPKTIEAGEFYEVEMKINIPDIVKDINNCKLVVMLIDGNTGRVINAAKSHLVLGVDEITADPAADVKVSVDAGGLWVESATHADVSAYSLAGAMIGRASGEGGFGVDLNGYSGVAIVKAVTETGSRTLKLIIP